MVLRVAGQYLSKKISNEKIAFTEKCLSIAIAASFLAGISFPRAIEMLFRENTVYAVIIIQIIMTYYIAKKILELQKEKSEIETQATKDTKWCTWEQEVAYELSLLQWKYQNFYVIHDFQNTRVGNIDHIIICEKWVFAIETKNHNYIEKWSRKEKKQAIDEVVELQKKLSEKFWIQWVSGIFTVINEDNLKYVQSEKYCDVCYYKDLWKTIEKSTKRIFIDQIEEIYKYLVELQQKKS